MRPHAPVASARRAPGMVACLLFVLLVAGSAEALQIRFETRDLPDVGTGDLRELTLTLSPFDRGAGFGVSVLFSPDLYAGLEAPTPSSDWDLLLIQPDPALPDFGRYDLQARVASPSVAAPFVLSFVWLGSGEPGANPFEVYDPSFQTVETGATSSVPEAGTAWLGLGIAPLLLRSLRPLSRRPEGADAGGPR